MYKFTLPDYYGNSIINLMSSISNSFGKKHNYPQLKSLKSEELKRFKNILLIVIDGLGYNYLIKQENSFLSGNIRSKITSTFLSTTACANTSFLVGYPPQYHTLTGWDINLKEIGAITTILPFTPMYGKESLSKSGFDISHIMDTKPFYKGFNGECFILIDKKIAYSSFTRYISKNAKVIPTKNYKDTFKKIRKLIKNKSKERKFIHVYLPEMDSLAHKHSTKSIKLKNMLLEFDKRIKKLSEIIKNTNTKVIITGDHGLIDTSQEKEIWVNDINGFEECLTIPLAGEPRVRNCYVRPNKTKKFENIVKTKMSRYCWCFKGEQLIKDNLYGLEKPNKKLFDRVGDYVLIMKENYILRDKLANYKKPEKFGKGCHGGVSNDEMIVPLIIVDC